MSTSEQMQIQKKLNDEIRVFYNQYGKKETDEFFQPMLDRKKPPTFSEFISDKVMMIFMIRQGMPYSLFDTISSFTPFTEKDWAEFLDLSPKSLQRYKTGQRDFKSFHSEKIIEVAEVTSMGLETFGSHDKFRNWLNTPSFALGNIAPFELLKDSYGKEMVIAELNHIAHGILA